MVVIVIEGLILFYKGYYYKKNDLFSDRSIGYVFKYLYKLYVRYYLLVYVVVISV